MVELLKSRFLSIEWLGNSLEILRDFPDEVRRSLGNSLRKIQLGEASKMARPMKSVGKGVFELKEADERGWYRLMYVVKKKECIIVLHCFEKKSRKTGQRDLEIAKK